MDFSKELTHIISTTSGMSRYQPYSFLHAFTSLSDIRWKPFDTSRNWPDLGPKFKAGEDAARAALAQEERNSMESGSSTSTRANRDKEDIDNVEHDKRDLDWSAVLKRTFEAYIRGERPNMYGEWLQW
jgi:WD repeat and SOF domain-containing protein 1